MKNWKRIIGGCLAAGMLALFGCGGGSGSSAPATATGKFIDAPVVGLSYVSGNQKGVTGADGSFTYEVGKPVKFTIGGIVLGEAPAKALMTPIDLSTTTGADSTTPDVLARVQLLMSLSSTDPASGTITIPTATLDAAKDKTIDFTSSADLAVKIAALPNPRNIVMVTTDQATAHFKGTLDKMFIASMLSGKTIYEASTDGYGSNTYNANGTMSGSGPTLSGTPVESAGATWAITANGTLQRTSSRGTTTITLISINMTESYWAVTDVGSNGTSGTMRMFFNASTGLTQAQSYYNSIKTTSPPTTFVFTTAMLAGHTATVNFTKGPTAFVFAATGTTVTTSGITGTWVINTNGTLTVTFPSDSLTFTIVSGSGNNLIVTDTHAATPTVVEGPDTMTII